MQIILRARQTHLVDKFRSESTSLTQELLDTVQSSWESYVRSKVSKGLPADEVPPFGLERQTWSKLSIKISDKAWKDEAIKKDEKFEMHFNAAVSPIIYQSVAPVDPAILVSCPCCHSNSERFLEIRADGYRTCATACRRLCRHPGFVPGQEGALSHLHTLAL